MKALLKNPKLYVPILAAIVGGAMLVSGEFRAVVQGVCDAVASHPKGE